VHSLPVGNAGNITAYWKGYTEYTATASPTGLPRMLGTQAAGAAPLVLGEPVSEPGDHRHRDPHRLAASWTTAVEAQQAVQRRFLAATDEEILAAYHLVARTEGVRRARIGGQHRRPAEVDRGRLGWRRGRRVCTVTGNGLKDPDTALKGMPAVTPVRLIPRPWSRSWGWSKPRT